MLKVAKIVAVLIFSSLILVACGDVGTPVPATKVNLTMKSFKQGSNYPGLGYPPQDPLFDKMHQVYAILSLEVTVPVDASIKDQKKKILDALTVDSVITEWPKGYTQYTRLDPVYKHTMKAVQDGNNWKVTGDLIYLVFYEPDDRVIEWDGKIQGEPQRLLLQYPED